LYTLLIDADPDARMPQEDDPLSPDQIATVKRWISQGAVYDGPSKDATLKSILPPPVYPDPPETYRVPVPVFAVAFSRDGKSVYVGGYHEVTQWDATTGEPLARVSGMPQRVMGIALHPTEPLLLVGGGTPGEHGETLLVDLSQDPVAASLGFSEDVVHDVAFSPDGQTALSGGADFRLQAFDVEKRTRLWQARLHSAPITSVGFSHDGALAGSASQDHTVKLHHVKTGDFYFTYKGHQSNKADVEPLKVYALAFDSQGPTAISAGEGANYQLWDPAKNLAGDGVGNNANVSKKDVRHGFQNDVLRLQLKDGHLFGASADGTVRDHDLKTGKQVRAFTGHSDWVHAIDYHPASQRLASGALDGIVKIWNADGKCAVSFHAAPGYREPAK
ncbi:MAG: WD40 repeat domain-containing protein, partial [Planctomycetales bacterium]